jgi:hypothetical protein
MPEIAESQALLAALAETDAFKADASRRQQRQQLHVAYGNALIAARGYGAPETTEAFVKARESAACAVDAPERLAADYGLWAGSYIRGELAAIIVGHAHAPVVEEQREGRPALEHVLDRLGEIVPARQLGCLLAHVGHEIGVLHRLHCPDPSLYDHRTHAGGRRRIPGAVEGAVRLVRWRATPDEDEHYTCAIAL